MPAPAQALPATGPASDPMEEESKNVPPPLAAVSVVASQPEAELSTPVASLQESKQEEEEEKKGEGEQQSHLEEEEGVFLAPAPRAPRAPVGKVPAETGFGPAVSAVVCPHNEEPSSIVAQQDDEVMAVEPA